MVTVCLPPGLTSSSIYEGTYARLTHFPNAMDAMGRGATSGNTLAFGPRHAGSG
jgi:hypothetical protein